MKSLFGTDIPDDPPLRKAKPIDYSRPFWAGSGPNGKTCGDCRWHVKKHSHGKTYMKCWLMHRVWSKGAKTDIRLKDAACKKFEHDLESRIELDS